MVTQAAPKLAFGSRAERGRTVLRTYLNVFSVPPSPSTALFDATGRTGRAMDLAMRIRRHGQLSGEKLYAFASLAFLSPSDLTLWCIPELERAGLLEARRDRTTKRIVDIEEQVGVAAPVLEQAASLWERLDPSVTERCAIAASDHLTYAPMTESDHRGALEAQGFDKEVQDDALRALAAVNMLHRLRSEKLREDVLYSPYVWGTEAVNIAEFMKNLPANERQVLAGLSRSVADAPGVSLQDLKTSERLLRGAQKVGLFDTARVVTQSGAEKDFAFSPSLERALQLGSTDVAHERKLFVAHILFGHRYAPVGTGRIGNPVILVEKLIRTGSVGPATAISRDYPLLEAKGIVRVEKSGDRGYLRLVKDDVAKDGLELLRHALGDSELHSNASSTLASLWLPGTAFRSPENRRAELPPLQPGAEADVLHATIERLREETGRKMRREDI